MTMPKKTKAEILEEMNAEAKRAREEFNTMTNSDFSREDMSDWWKKWYLTAGHKRLAYVLMGKKLEGD